jgi:serine/threonine protein phosphatase 1
MESFDLRKDEYVVSGELRLVGPVRESLGEAASLLDNLETHRQTGNLLLVHAGVNPSVPLAEWSAGDPLREIFDQDSHFACIRFPFLGHGREFEYGLIIVHGHTPEDSVQFWKGSRNAVLHRLDGWRLGLDGGSNQTGISAGAQFRNGVYRVFVDSIGPPALTCRARQQLKVLDRWT